MIKTLTPIVANEKKSPLRATYHVEWEYGKRGGGGLLIREVEP